VRGGEGREGGEGGAGGVEGWRRDEGKKEGIDQERDDLQYLQY
jgi:hypothetical protein